jgi:hypothetical protein
MQLIFQIFFKKSSGRLDDYQCKPQGQQKQIQDGAYGVHPAEPLSGGQGRFRFLKGGYLPFCFPYGRIEHKNNKKVRKHGRRNQGKGNTASAGGKEKDKGQN